tara:strand:+ start:78 stop:293 length:216 start_codon:yes stop_codon:yes gene_type:complete
MKQLYDIYKEGWWIKVSPLARKEPECWVCSIYKKSKFNWITEECKDFDTPEAAYEWALNLINAKITAELYK